VALRAQAVLGERQAREVLAEGIRYEAVPNPFRKLRFISEEFTARGTVHPFPGFGIVLKIREELRFRASL